VSRVFVWALVLVLLPAAVHADCSPGPNRSPSINTPDYVYLVPDSITASATATAQAAWAGCVSNNRPGFPFPTQTPLWNAYWAQLNVVYHSGFNPLDSHTCGSTTGQNINVYQTAFKPGSNTITVACSSYGFAQIIEHELGHYYGLADITNQPGCTDIMSQLDGSPHYVTGSDCNMANSQNQTLSENNPIDYSCQQPCFTTCVGGNCPATNSGSPIVLDLDGGGFRLSGPDDPVYFDLDADGVPIWTAWTARGSATAFLALDLNGNGKIDDAGELFGNHTRLMDGTFANHGYEALAQYDEVVNGGNANGIIDPGDAVFARLRIWTDWNHDGKTDPGELLTLSEAGIVAIDLGYRSDRKQDRYGNEFRFRGRALQSNGTGDREVTTYDVFFVPAQPPPSPSSTDERMPDVLFGFRPQAVTGFPAERVELCASVRRDQITSNSRRRDRQP
jgi:hypothetical protein